MFVAPFLFINEPVDVSYQTFSFGISSIVEEVRYK